MLLFSKGLRWVGGAAGFACATTVVAAPLSLTASQGNLQATVNFTDNGGDLLVTLTNSSANDVLVPADILTAVFFDIAGLPTLTQVSATLHTGSTVLFGGSDPGGVVGGEWGYRGDLAGNPYGADYGIGASGFSVFGPGDLFPGSNLQGPASPDGLQYGISSTGDNPLTGNTPVTGTNALIQDSVVFRLGGLPSGFDPMRDVSNITFQYGTDLSEPHFPEPGSGLLLSAIAILGLRRRS
ncbi:MAG: XDD4 family exosortase-dependent surface protein [Phycisphaerae bacterium]